MNNEEQRKVNILNSQKLKEKCVVVLIFNCSDVLLVSAECAKLIMLLNQIEKITL